MKYLNEIGSKTEGHLVINNRPSTSHSTYNDGPQQSCPIDHFSASAGNVGNSNASSSGAIVPKGLLLRLSLSENNVRRFNHCCWSKNSTQLLASDHIGSVYLLDLISSRWQLVNNVGSASTALCFNLKRNSSEYLIATADSPLIRCFSTDNRSLVGTLRGHKHPAFSISVRQKANQHSHHLFYDDYVLTVSLDSCFLWDLRDFSQKRKLTVQNGAVKFQSGLFCGNNFSEILTVFKDQSIFVWDAKSMSKKYKIDPIKEHVSCVKCVCVSPDGEELALAGSGPEADPTAALSIATNEQKECRRVAIFNLLTGQLEQVFEIQSLTSDIYQLFYLSKRFNTKAYSPTLGVLSKSGYCVFVNTATGNEVGTLGDKKFGFYKTHFPSFTGEKIASINLESKIDIFKTEFALPKISGLAAAPLVKVVGRLWSSKAKKSRQKSFHSNRNDILVEQKEGRELDYSHDGTAAQLRFQSCPFITSRQTASQGTNSMPKPPVKGGVIDSTSTFNKDTDRLDALGSARLSHKKLGRILQGYNSYPERYRKFIWQTLLELPLNEASFTSLVSRGSHPAWKDIGEKFQIKSPRLVRILEKILSALAYYSELFCELEYLPMLVFPFVKIFQYNHLVCFEVCVTFLRNYCLHWYEFFPNPPIGVLSVIENIIAENDKTVYHHLLHMKITSQTYAWPILQTMFSEVLTKNELLVFLDHLFYNRSSLYLLCCVAAYIIICKEPILRIAHFDDFEYFFRHRNAININILMKKADFLYVKTLDNQANLRFSRHYTKAFEPLSKGQYPIFNNYPEFIVDYRKKETERIRKEQKKELTERADQQTSSILNEINRVRSEAEQWLKEQKALDDAVNERRIYINNLNGGKAFDSHKAQTQEMIDKFERLKSMTKMSPQREYAPRHLEQVPTGKVYNSYSAI